VQRPLHSIPEVYMTARKVLIVEDNAALLRGLKDNFQAQGYQVRTANDGEKGLEALFRDPPDLVLLDLMLPKVNGYEICRQARARQLSTPILMLSAKCQEDDVVRGLELGADDYVTKPFGIRELLARAKRLSKSRAGVRPAPGLWTLCQPEPETIPKGLNHPAQGCEERATLGKAGKRGINSERVASLRRVPGSQAEDSTPSELMRIIASASQGSARCATLGSVISSFQDGAPQKTCKLPGAGETPALRLRPGDSKVPKP